MILIIFDLLGIISFAASGALVALKKRLDIFGVVFLAIICATGGGILRDVLLGYIPPVSLVNPINMGLSAISAIIIFLIYNKHGKNDKVKLLITVLDTIGLSIFTVVGAEKAILLDKGILIVVISGMITAVGGGIIRDVLAGRIPEVLKSEVYASAAIIGSIIFYFLYQFVRVDLAIYISIFITILIRAIAIKNRLSLPKIDEDIDRHLRH